MSELQDDFDEDIHKQYKIVTEQIDDDYLDDDNNLNKDIDNKQYRIVAEQVDNDLDDDLDDDNDYLDNDLDDDYLHDDNDDSDNIIHKQYRTVAKQVDNDFDIGELVNKYYYDEKMMNLLYELIEFSNKNDFYYSVGFRTIKIESEHRYDFMNKFGFNINILYGLIASGNIDCLKYFWQRFANDINPDKNKVYKAIVSYEINDINHFYEMLKYLSSQMVFEWGNLLNAANGKINTLTALINFTRDNSYYT